MDACPGARTEAAVGVPRPGELQQGTQGSLAAEELVSCCQVAPAPSSPSHPPKALVGSRRRARCPHPTSWRRLEPAQRSQARNLEARMGHQGRKGLGAGAQGGHAASGSPTSLWVPSRVFPHAIPSSSSRGGAGGQRQGCAPLSQAVPRHPPP